MTKTWIWISGWAVYPDQFKSAFEQALPEDSHQVLTTGPDVLEKVLAADADRIGGYSLGSLILLSALKQIPKNADITCLAPFIAFCKEERLGGTTPKAALQTLQKRLLQNPLKTLLIFHRLSGLNDCLADHLPYPIEHLEWGLEQLATLKADMNYPDRVKAFTGLEDTLIDSKEMRSRWPTCHFIDDCNHDYHRLLPALSNMDSV